MTYHISFSGGLGSAVSALVAHDAGLDFTLLFADTLIEDDDLYRFIEDVSDRVGVPVTYLRDGRTPWQVFRDVRFHGNSRTAHCSQVLKTDQVRAWLDDNAEPDEPLVLGMDMSEQDRIDRAAARWAPRPVISLLNERDVWRPQYEEWLARYDLRRPRLYNLGFEHNNCGGFCVRAGIAHHKRLLRVFPERYAHHEAQQDAMMRDIETARPHLKETVDGEARYLTMRELRERVQLQPDLFDDEPGPTGCGCFIDEVNR